MNQTEKYKVEYRDLTLFLEGGRKCTFMLLPKWSIFLDDSNGPRLMMIKSVTHDKNVCSALYNFIEGKDDYHQNEDAMDRMRLIKLTETYIDKIRDYVLIVYETDYGWWDTRKERKIKIEEIRTFRDPELMSIFKSRGKQLYEAKLGLKKCSYEDITSILYKDDECEPPSGAILSIFFDDYNGLGARLLVVDKKLAASNRKSACHILYTFIEGKMHNKEAKNRMRNRMRLIKSTEIDTNAVKHYLVYKPDREWQKKVKIIKHQNYIVDPNLVKLLKPQEGHWLTKALGMSVLGGGALYLGHRYSKRRSRERKERKKERKEGERKKEKKEKELSN